MLKPKHAVNILGLLLWLWACAVVLPPLLRSQTGGGEQRPKEQLAALQRMIESSKNDLARVQQLLLFLAGLGAVYGLVQGTLAYKNLEAIEKRSQEDAKRYKEWVEEQRKDLDKSQKELEALLPGFQGLDKRLHGAEQQISSIQEKVGIYRSQFKNVSEEDRGRIEFFEQYLPAFEILRGQRKDQLGRLYLGMSVYYLAKAREGRIWGSQLPGTEGLVKGGEVGPDPQSGVRLEAAEYGRANMRSRLYLERATQLTSGDYRVLNEHAYRYLHDGEEGVMTGNPLSKKNRLRLARELLQQSLRVFSGQQRGLSMLAFIEDEDALLGEAEKLYQKALALEVWEEEGQAPTQGQKEMMHYNFACCLAQRIREVKDDQEKLELARKSLEQLQRCFSYSSSKLPYLRVDVMEGNSLAAIREVQHCWQDLMKRLAKLEAEQQNRA